jgi:hypothetical protein
MVITRKHILSLIFLTVFSLLTIVAWSPALASDSLVNGQIGLNDVGRVYGSATPQDIRVIIAKIVNVILTLLGVIFLALTIFAGFQYMTAAGNEEKTKKAVDLLRDAIIGLVIILAAWAITRYTIIVLNNTVSNAPAYTDYLPY